MLEQPGVLLHSHTRIKAKSELYPFQDSFKEIMGRPCFNKLLLLFSLLLLLCFSHGFGRQLTETVDFEDSTAQLQETGGESREMIEAMDYKDPGPNTNPKTGYIFSPPPS